MTQQVISIGLGGVMQGLQRKANQGIDLRKFGEADIQRVSLVEWSADHQMWYIIGKRGVMNGRAITYNMFLEAFELGKANPAEGIRKLHSFFEPSDTQNVTIGECGDPLFFYEYDDAVRIEIAFYDQWRKRGRTDIF